MTKNELIYEVSMVTGFTQKDVRTILETSFSCIEKEVSGGGKVLLTGFGTFETKVRKCRCLGAESQRMAIPVFRAGESLKRACKGGSRNT